MSQPVKDSGFLQDMPEDVPFEVRQSFARAVEIVGWEEVCRAVDRLAVQVTVELQDKNPIVLAVLHGGLYFTGMLLERLVFPLQQGYVQVSRYGHETSGGELSWLARQHPALAGRHVLIADDVLDRGVTLRAIADWAVAERAASVQTAVLAVKDVERVIEARFAALHVPDKFLVGCGMDFMEYGRNLPGIYALPE